jgi:predicted  nucleic acid-binding Zn ribbon protein
MARLTIRIYQQADTATQTARRLIRTKFVDTASSKRLTSKRAGQVLANKFPKFESARNGMIKTQTGWQAMRPLQPTDGCSFHYIWQYAVVTEDDET